MKVNYDLKGKKTEWFSVIYCLFELIAAIAEKKEKMMMMMKSI